MTHADNQLPDELLSASRVTGADILFLYVVQRVSLRETGCETPTDALAAERIVALHEQFRKACASIFKKHVGESQALQSLKALESAPLQRYLGARRAMVPALTQELAKLQARMGRLEV